MSSGELGQITASVMAPLPKTRSSHFSVTSFSGPANSKTIIDYNMEFD